MKCKTCGYDVKETLTHCPMCGTRVNADPFASSATTELSWNTKDFPKPKEMTDINMSWPEFNTKGNTTSISEEEISAALEKKRPVTLLAEDASEGYVSIPDKKEERLEVKPAAPAEPEKPKTETPAEQPFWYTQKFTATGVMQTGPAWPMAPGSPQSYPATAKIETMTLSDPIPIVPGASGIQENVNKEFTLSDLIKESTQKPEDTGRPSGSGFYTFQKKNDEFQKLLDREYDRIHALHGDDYDPLRGTVHPLSADEPVKAKELSAFEKLLLDEEEQTADETPAQKFFSQDPEPEKPKAEKAAADIKDLRDPELPEMKIPTGDPSTYNIEEIENTIKELNKQEVIAEQNRRERRKRLENMAKAREEYFRSLDAAAGKTPAVKAQPAPKEEPAKDYTKLFETSDAEVAEPTREIPVGGILEAITGEKPARTAALKAAPVAQVSSEPFKTIVFKRISEDAERLATKYDLGGELKGIAAAEGVAEAYEQQVPKTAAAVVSEAGPEQKAAAETPAKPEAAQPAEPAAQQEPGPADLFEAEPVKTEPLEAGPVQVEPAEQEIPSVQPEANEPAEEHPAVTETPEKPAEHTQEFEPVSDDTSSLAFLYEDGNAQKTEEEGDQTEPSEEESRPRHIFLKIIIAILIICALFELVVLGLTRFLPDAQATQNIVAIEEAIREAIVSAFNSIVNAVKGLFGN